MYFTYTTFSYNVFQHLYNTVMILSLKLLICPFFSHIIVQSSSEGLFSHYLLSPFLYFIVTFACYIFTFILIFLSNVLVLDLYENVFMCYVYLGIYLLKDKSHFLVISPVVNTVILTMNLV